MFTALHRDDQGNETLWTCTHVRKFTSPHAADAQGTTGYGPGIMLDLVAPYPVDHGSTVFYPYSQLGREQSGGRDSGAKNVGPNITPCIIVMNDHGRTVAKYDL
jgi:hypothetical protein